MTVRTLASACCIVVISLCGQQHTCVDAAAPDQSSGASQVVPLRSTETHVGAACQGMADDQGGADDTAMMQLKVASVAQRMHQATPSSATCGNLHNSGSAFVIDVWIGIPPQKFELITDTGSNALIVPSCTCVQMGNCPGNNDCFNSSRSLSYNPHYDNYRGSYVPKIDKITYGSGPIIVEEASDNVQVANLSAYMNNGVFLLEDRRQLRVGGSFEGILGLGLPGALGQGSFPLWAQVAHVSRYSLCFNENVPGALVLNGDSLKNPMTNMGQVHWGLDFQGMSVGSASTPVLFCDPASKGKNMVTACGAVVDSGTTFVMGPQKDILTLYRSICQHWPRCKNSATFVDKALVFQHLLYTCGNWLTPTQGLNEIPPISLHLAGKNGAPQTFSLSPWSYVAETTQEQFERVIAVLHPGVVVQEVFPTGITTKICQATFGAQEMATIENGPVWILGTPLFFEYTVAYDIGSQPFHIALMDGPCQSCHSSGTALISSEAVVRADQARAKGVPRKVKGPQREPNLHISAHM